MSLQPYDDPGWGPAVKRLVPGLGARAGVMNGLVTIRVLFLVLLTTALTMSFVMASILDGVGSPDPLLAGVIVVLGTAGVGAAKATSNRPLEGADGAEVAAAYRTSFFVGFLLVEVPLFAGFGLSFLEEALWPYLVGLPFHLVGMAVIAPGRRNIDKRDEQLLRRGSTVSLRRVLTEPPGPG